jgi:hypothetical protein
MSCKIKISTPRGIQGSLCRLTVAYQKEIDNPSLSAEEKQAMENLFAAMIQNARVEPLTRGMAFHNPAFYNHVLDPNRPSGFTANTNMKKET